LSKNFFGKKCVYASIRICGPPAFPGVTNARAARA
jgi:hypothetical protein